MKSLFLLTFLTFLSFSVLAQNNKIDSTLRVIRSQKDSTLKAIYAIDSLKTEREFAEKERHAKLFANAYYPAIKAGKGSGVIPVKDPTEVPDPSIDYKILFELVENNPDSLLTEINYYLVNIARVINLHVASGIPLKKIFPVIVVHGAGLKAITNNEYYKAHYKMDNPNLKLIKDLTDVGATFIACGQAMAGMGIKKEEMLPVVKISLTAKTVISSYQLKGYIMYPN